jgi:hypothetical protein
MPFAPIGRSGARLSGAAIRPASAALFSLCILLPALASAAPRALLERREPSPGALAAGALLDPARVQPLRVDRDALRAFRAEGRGRLSVPLPEGASVELVLEPLELFRDDARVIATGADGPRPIAMDLSLFRASVPGDPESWAVLSMSDGSMRGTIQTRTGVWSLGPAPGMDHAVARAAADAAGRIRCDVDALDLDPIGAGLRLRESVRNGIQGTSTRYEADIAVDCDFEYTNNLFGGNLTEATDYLTTLFATVSVIYERDINVQLRISYLNLWTTPADPWGTTTTQEALPEFRDWCNANLTASRDLAHHVSGRNLGGGIAYLDVLCGSPFGYGVSSVNGQSTFPTSETTYDVFLIAHELGHNFGSYHTQNCFWQSAGLAPAGALLDSCFAAEGTCYNGPVGVLPPNKGTIMSYCPVPQTVRLEFHPACVTVMRQTAENGCLQVPVPQPPTGLSANPLPTGAQLVWVASTSPNVIRYDVYRSTTALDLAPTLIGNTTGTTFPDASVGSFFYKVKAVRAGDQSAFSNEVRVTLCSPTAPVSYNTGNQSIAVARGDFNEDGIEDLAVSNFIDGTVAILRGGGAGGVGDGTFLAASTYPAGSFPSAIAVADFNEDGIPDLALSNFDGTEVQVLRGQGAGGVGDGTFTFLTHVPVAPSAWDILAGDFNEDGIVDLATASAGGTVSILIGNGSAGVGNGSFAPAVDIAVGSGSRALAMADFNADGIADLAVANGSSNNVRILLGNGTDGHGDGTFTPGASYATQSLPHALDAGDFNEDGIIDLAVGNASSSSISILIGNGAGGGGDGTFAAAVHYPTGANPYDLTIMDWDGDGIADIGSNSFTAAGLIWILPGKGSTGVGNGTFGGSQSFAAGPSPRAIVAGDFNEDSRPDLAVANAVTAGRVSIVRGTCVGALSTFIEVQAPDTTVVWQVGAEHDITWSKGASVIAVNIELSRDGGTNWEMVARGVPGTSFAWTVTEPVTNQARVRIVDSTVPSRGDTGDTTFTITTTATGIGDPRPVALAIRGIVPNPAAREMQITFALPAPGAARLELLDLAGRAVRAVEVADRGPGVQVVRLDGGATLAPGLYVVRLSQAGRAVSAKVAVLQ